MATEQPQRRETPLKIPSSSVIVPAEYGLPEASAWQAIARGEANKDQQILALRWLLNGPCGLHDLQYRPGENGRRDTDFACGKRYVGQQVVKLININIAALQQRKRT